MAYTRTQLNSTLAIISARHNELYPHLAVNNCICISQLNSISSRTWLNRLISNLNIFTPPICLEKGAYYSCIAAPANRTENCLLFMAICNPSSYSHLFTPFSHFTRFSSFSLSTTFWHWSNFCALSPCKHFQVIQLFVGLNSDFAWLYSIWYTMPCASWITVTTVTQCGMLSPGKLRRCTRQRIWYQRSASSNWQTDSVVRRRRIINSGGISLLMYTKMIKLLC